MVGLTFCVVEFSYLGLCRVCRREGLPSSAIYLGNSLGEDKLGARDSVQGARQANISPMLCMCCSVQEYCSSEAWPMPLAEVCTRTKRIKRQGGLQGGGAPPKVTRSEGYARDQFATVKIYANFVGNSLKDMGSRNP